MADIFFDISKEEQDKSYNLLQDINAIDEATSNIESVINDQDDNIVINKSDFEAFISSYIPEDQMEEIIEKEASKSKGKVTIDANDLKTLLKYSLAYKEIMSNQRNEIVGKVDKEYIDFQGHTR